MTELPYPGAVAHHVMPWYIHLSPPIQNHRNPRLLHRVMLRCNSPVNEKPPQMHASRTRKHELGDVTLRPPLRGFASLEKVPTPPLSFCLANCGVVCLIYTSSFGTHPKCSATGDSAPTAPAPASATRLRPVRPCGSTMRIRHYGHTHGECPWTTAMISSNSTLPTRARSVTSMHSNAGVRMVRMERS